MFTAWGWQVPTLDWLLQPGCQGLTNVKKHIVACFMENMFYKAQGTIYHKFIHSAADWCFNAGCRISVSLSSFKKKKKVRKKFQSYFLSACFYLMVLKFPHRKPFKLLIFYFKQSKYFITEGYFITKFTSTYSCESFQQCIYFWSQEFTACQVLL